MLGNLMLLMVVIILKIVLFPNSENSTSFQLKDLFRTQSASADAPSGSVGSEGSTGSTGSVGSEGSCGNSTY